MSEEQTPAENQKPTAAAPADQPVAAAAPAEPTVKSLSGFDEGEVLPDGDVVKGSYDEAGKLIGWHKEPGNSDPHPVANATGEDEPIVADPNEPEPTVGGNE